MGTSKPLTGGVLGEKAAVCDVGFIGTGMRKVAVHIQYTSSCFHLVLGELSITSSASELFVIGNIDSARRSRLILCKGVQIAQLDLRQSASEWPMTIEIQVLAQDSLVKVVHDISNKNLAQSEGGKKVQTLFRFALEIL